MGATVLLAALLAAACTHHRRVENVPPELMGETLTVRGADGWPYRAHAEATPSGIVWRDEEGRDVIRLADTAEAIEIDTGVGALEGLFFGFLAGIPVGAAGGLLLGDDDCQGVNGPCFSAQDKAVALGVLGALSGGLVGAIAGGSRGSRFVYSFDHSKRRAPASGSR